MGQLCLTASNIDFSAILETPSYLVFSPCCIKPPKIELDLVYLKNDHTDASVYQQLFMKYVTGTASTFLFIHMNHGTGILWLS